MSAKENKETLRRYFDDYFNKGDLSRWNDMVDKDYVMRRVGAAESKGLEAAKQGVAQMKAISPDMRINIEEMVGEGDVVAVRGEFTGTFTGDYQGVKVNGKKYVRPYAAFYVFKNGKIASVWTVQDWMGTAQQFGFKLTQQ